MSKHGHDFDDKHGDTPVAVLNVILFRSGAMSVGGSITDERYALHLIDTARDTIRSYHAKQRLGLRSNIIVPAYDTSLVGTEDEKKLLAARDELANAMSKD